MKLGERITKLRQDKELSLTKLANLSGVSKAYLFQIEKGLAQALQ